MRFYFSYSQLLLVITVSVINTLSTFFSPVILPLSRRTNELKSEINISDDLIEKFKNFWSHFRDTPLKGKNLLLLGNDYACFVAFIMNNYSPAIHFSLIFREKTLHIFFVKIYAKFFNVLVKSGRNAILRGICPQVFGLFTVKLAGILYAQFFCQHLFSLSCLTRFLCSCLDTHWRCATC